MYGEKKVLLEEIRNEIVNDAKLGALLVELGKTRPQLLFGTLVKCDAEVLTKLQVLPLLRIRSDCKDDHINSEKRKETGQGFLKSLHNSPRRHTVLKNGEVTAVPF